MKEIFNFIPVPDDCGLILLAITFTRLGRAYLKRTQFRPSENNSDEERAIKCCELSLAVWERTNLPIEWAETQNCLAKAYSKLKQGNLVEHKDKAIYHYEKALEVYTQKEFPDQWATIQNNLGISYRRRWRGNEFENIEKAIGYYLEALKVRKRNVYPTQWATTQTHLGVAYLNRILENEVTNIEKAIECFHNALQVLTPNDFPRYWATAQLDLGDAYFKLSFLQEDSYKEQAIQHYQKALKFYQDLRLQKEAAEMEMTLSFAYSMYFAKDGKAKDRELAIKYCESSLSASNQKDNPLGLVNAQTILGSIYKHSEQYDNAYDSFYTAIETLESSRGDIAQKSATEEDKQKLAEELGLPYLGMVEVCVALAKNDPNYHIQAIEYAERSKARNLAELLANKDLYPDPELFSDPNEYQEICTQLEKLRRNIPAKQRQLEMI